MSSDLPQSVLDLVELSPIEDILIAVLREGLPDVPVLTLIPETLTYPMVHVRRMHSLGDWAGDPRFTDSARFLIYTFTEDPNGDENGALLQEAVRVVLRNAWLDHKNVAGLGSIIKIKLLSEPVRRPDFAPAQGPVQFADLPTGIWRYESNYSVAIRKPIA